MLIKIQTEVDGEGPEGLTYSYNVKYGKIEGTGPTVTWNLEGVFPGEYVVEVTVFRNDKKLGAFKTSAMVMDTPDGDYHCPSYKIFSDNSEAETSSFVEFTLVNSGGHLDDMESSWMVENGEFLEGGTEIIKSIVVTGDPDDFLVISVDLKSRIASQCSQKATKTLKIIASR